MDYEKEYKEALERAKAGKPLDEVFPELKESEDERIRKLLVWQVYRNIEDETNDLAGSVYDGIKGHDPDLEESIDDWKKCLAYLEKQKEQKPLSSEETELNSIAFLEQMGYTCIPPRKEQQPAEWSEEDEALIENVCTALKGYALHERKVDLDEHAHRLEEMSERLKSLRPQPKVELTLLDKNIIEAAVAFVEQNDHFNCYGGIDKHTVIKALRSLKPSWKPSEEQMDALNSIILNGSFTYVGQVQDLISLKDELKKL